MSTRCQICTTNNDGSLYSVRIYKHSDGYPDGVMPTLEPFAKRFAEERGYDPEYLIAQCVRAFAFSDMLEMQEREKKEGRGTYFYDPTKSFTGWGLCDGWHGDIEYLYIVAPDGSVKIIDPKLPDDWPDDQIPEGPTVPWPGAPEDEEATA